VPAAARLHLARLVVLVSSLSLVAVCGACGMSQGSGADTDAVGLTTYAEGHRKPMPDISGPGLDGSRLSLADIGTDRIVFLNVWASWCAPCREESPLLAEAAVSLAPRGIRFLGLDEQDRPVQARQFARSAHTTYPSVTDPDGKLLRRLRMLPQSGIPSTLVIDREGKIAARVIGRVTRNDIRRILVTLGVGG
jgi:thiol-disulfide isomerase/thioredoxin